MADTLLFVCALLRRRCAPTPGTPRSAARPGAAVVLEVAAQRAAHQAEHDVVDRAADRVLDAS